MSWRENMRLIPYHFFFLALNKNVSLYLQRVVLLIKYLLIMQEILFFYKIMSVF